jgi:hypothetical protein
VRLAATAQSQLLGLVPVKSPSRKVAFCRLNYLPVAEIHNEKIMAAAISIAHAASEQPHRMRATPATVAGAIARAATPARCWRVTLHRPENQTERLLS